MITVLSVVSIATSLVALSVGKPLVNQMAITIKPYFFVTALFLLNFVALSYLL